MELFIQLGDKNKPVLFIFPHAGAMPLQYINWSKKYFAQDFCIFIAKSNGQASNWSELIHSYNAELKNLVTRQSYFFGHSMGGLVASQLAQNFPREKVRLFLSAITPPAPSNLVRYRDLAKLPLQSFIQQITSFGGIANELIEKPELLLRYANDIQNDFKILASINSSDNFKTDKDIECIAALEDRIAPHKQIEHWKDFTSGNFKLKLFSGSHFYLFEKATQVKDYLLAQTNS